MLDELLGHTKPRPKLDDKLSPLYSPRATQFNVANTIQDSEPLPRIYEYSNSNLLSSPMGDTQNLKDLKPTLLMTPTDEQELRQLELEQLQVKIIEKQQQMGEGVKSRVGAIGTVGSSTTQGNKLTVNMGDKVLQNQLQLDNLKLDENLSQQLDEKSLLLFQSPFFNRDKSSKEQLQKSPKRFNEKGKQ